MSINKPAWGERLIDEKGIATQQFQSMLDALSITLDGAIILNSYAVADVPPPADYPSGAIFVSDETGGSTMAFSDGNNWRRVQDRAIIS